MQEKLELKHFKDTVLKHDVILLCETWTSPNSLVDIEGYTRFSKHRQKKKSAKRYSGGIEFYIKNCFAEGVKIKTWENEDGLHIVFDNVFFNFKKSVSLFFIYCKPSDSSRQDLETEGDCFAKLENEISLVYDYHDIIVVGDTNSRVALRQEVCFKPLLDCTHDLLNLPIYENAFTENDFLDCNFAIDRSNQDTGNNDNGPKLVDLCYTMDLAIINGRAFSDKGIGAKTFHGPRGESSIDHLLCNKFIMKNLTDFQISDHLEYSDHNYINFKLKFYNQTSQTQSNIRSKRPKWREEYKKDFTDFLTKSDVDMNITNITEQLTLNNNEINLNNAINLLEKTFKEAGKCHQNNSNYEPKPSKFAKWFDTKCFEQKQKFILTRDHFKVNNSDETRHNMSIERNQYRSTCRKARSNYKRKEAERLVLLSKCDSRKFWQEIKSENKTQYNSACNFYEHFKSLANTSVNLEESAREEIEFLENKDLVNETVVEDLDKEITLDELNDSMKELKTKKSAGNDDILNEFLINASPAIKYLILAIFNCVLKLEVFPDQWSVGTITPVFKSGNKLEATNYRGICILSNLSKLMTKILNRRLNTWAEKEEILLESQFGFRKGRGTTDCLFILHTLIELMLGNGFKLYTAFIDYQKCYDYLDRAAIWAKLIKNGVSSRTVRLFRSMYSKMVLKVKGNNDVFESYTGLYQGEVTSPIFFSFFVNDLETHNFNEDGGIPIFNIFIQLLIFADDMAIFDNTIEGLQKSLDKLHTYCKKWGITVNTNKTKIVVFRKGGKVGRKCVWHYGDVLLEVVPYFKYLGVYITSGGSFSQNVKENVSKAKRAMFALNRIVANNKELLPKMKINLFNSLIVPILSYGCEVWGFCIADPIAKLHLSFLKSVLNVKKSTPNCFVYGELGVYPLHLERKIRIFKYWVKIVNSSECSFIRQMYNELVSQSILQPSTKTWVTLFKEMLFKMGLGEYWEYQDLINPKFYITEFTQRLYDNYDQEWSSEVEKSTQHRLFKHVKFDFCFEQYLHLNNSALRTSITKIRLSSHLFNIERGRWGKKKVDHKDRICSSCNVIEDEYHCIVECPLYSEIRKGLLPQNLLTKPSMYNFIEYFRCNVEERFHKIGKLCFRIMKKHKEGLLEI